MLRAIIVVAWWTGIMGCMDSKTQPKSSARPLGETMEAKDFDSKLALVDMGMKKDQVEKILGKPDDVQTPDDHAGTWTAGTSMVWAYGTSGHNTHPSKGAVYFDSQGNVQYVYGEQGRLKPVAE